MTIRQTLRKLLLTLPMAVAISSLSISSLFAAGGTFSPPSDAPATGTVINRYALVDSIVNNAIHLEHDHDYDHSHNGWSSGESALLIQMKGVEVDRSDTATHGDITNYNSAGRFEFVEIATVSGKNYENIVLTEKPTINFQTDGIVQLISIEKFTNKTINETITARPWDGKKGGVVAIDDSGTLTLNGTIDVTGLGFIGGQLAKETPFFFCLNDQNNYTGPLEDATGSKGEGIVVDVDGHRARRGHNSNGGGGGNITDAGGGGGGNFGAGGIGGRELDICDGFSHHGGLGGQALDYTPMNRLFMGGGGGSGSEISQPAEGGPRTGGGIIIIRAKGLISNGGALLAKGLSSNNDDGNGADGGGAGGSIGLVISNGIIGSPEIEVAGGHGGDEYNPEYAHGTGGGGGGGTVILNGPNCSAVHWTAEGGSSGISKLGAEVGDPTWGAKNGESGGCLTNFTNLPPPKPNAPPSPSIDIKACSAIEPLGQSPDGLEDLSFPKGYWVTSYYKGSDGVEGSSYSAGGLNDSGTPGLKVFMGEAYWGANGVPRVNIQSTGSLSDNRWSNLETPTSPSLPHPSYNGSTWASSGNPFYQIDLRQKMTFRGELKFGYGDTDVIDDALEVFVNGVRVYAWFPGGGAPNTKPGAGEGQTLMLEADDEVMIRFINWGDIGGFNLEIDSPMPDCSDTPEDGSTNPSGNSNNYGVASHSIDTKIRLGDTVDSEYTSISSANADTDTSDDGVAFTPIIPGSTTTITANVFGENGFLHAWIDWNGDGDFDDTNEHIAQDIQDGSINDTAAEIGVISFDAPVPFTVTESPTYIRIRWSTSPDLPPEGPATDGETEDYQVSTSGTPLSCDMNDLNHGLYSTGGISANSNALSSETLIFQASFDNEDWQGEINAFKLKTTDADGNVKSKVWSASDTMLRTGRAVFTYKPSDSVGIPLKWKQLQRSQKLSLRAGQKASMGKARLNWAKGSDANESLNGPLRVRKNILGDIVHSNLNLRGRYTNFGYKRLEGDEGTKYPGFLVEKRNTKDTLFVGSNDGMLHAFNANDGEELFSYLPNEVLPKIATISSPKYGCDAIDCLPHEYLVDGKSSVADAYFNNEWHNIFLGTLGLGGKAIYALDVTDPSVFSAQNVLWEISADQAPDNQEIYAELMGLSVPEPVVVRMKNGKWAAIVANGYESQSHRAALFIIDIETGQLIKSIDTGFGSITEKNGLSSPTAVDSDGDFITDVIYAGDLQGHMWSFDVSSTNPDEWGSKFGIPVATKVTVQVKSVKMLSSPCVGDNCNVVAEDEPLMAMAMADETPDPTKTRTASNKPQPMFRSCIDSACLAPKPITAKPQVGRNPIGGLMVYFGTGKYTDLGDNFKTNQNGHYDTFYGLYDNNELTDRGKLVEQTIMHEVEAGSGMKSRITSINPVNYPEHQGWFMNLLTPPDNGTDGEQVISQALLREGRLIFVTLSPSQSECAWDGSSWVMELNALDGNRLSVAPIDMNNDKKFTSEDSFSYNGKETIISGVRKESVGMLFEPPAIITHSTRLEGKYLTGSGGTIEMLRESNSRFSGRMSWKKLK